VTEETREAIWRATQEYDTALSVIRKHAAISCPGKAGRGHEARLGQAYRRLVQLGAAPPLRGKYKG
jgi:hypothetical protein